MPFLLEEATCSQFLSFQSEDGLWESLVVLPVPSLEKEQKVGREIRLCMPLSGEVKPEEGIRKVR